jgi:orotidine-5'-phosphate decarboxylase
MKNPLIIALDVASAAEARRVVDVLEGTVEFYKVGLELYTAAGMDFVRELIARGKQVFLDLKFYDIPETVRRATRQAALSGASLLTIHGSKAVMEAAVQGKEGSALRLLAVTVLTSFDQSDLAELGYPSTVEDLVKLRVRNAVSSGVDGIVCSAQEVAQVRQLAGPDVLLVTPGVRSAGAGAGDQKRIATPAQAIRDGADYLVIGRQVTKASDPRSAVEQILEEITAAVARRT